MTNHMNIQSLPTTPHPLRPPPHHLFLFQTDVYAAL